MIRRILFAGACVASVGTACAETLGVPPQHVGPCLEETAAIVSEAMQGHELADGFFVPTDGNWVAFATATDSGKVQWLLALPDGRSCLLSDQPS